jgi:LemA protein
MLWVLLAAIIALLLGGIWLYNRLVEVRNTTLAAWSDIDVQLKRRHDLIPKLVDAVKAYAGYEQSTLTRVTELRQAAQLASEPGQASRAEGELTNALHRVFALSEAYPDLKTSEQFLSLQREITQVEQDIQHARRYYNGAVKQQNVRVESFPDNLVARTFGFGLAEYFDWDGT